MSLHVMKIDKVIKMPFESPIFKGGAVTVQPLVTGEEMGKELRMGVINFSKGARTKLHTHTGDQVLLVTKGRGIVANETEEFAVGVGTAIFIPSGEKHWHGATMDSDFSHVAITRTGCVERIIE